MDLTHVSKEVSGAEKEVAVEEWGQGKYVYES